MSDLALAVQRFLRERWDPIGVRHIEDAADEYDSYVSGIVGVLTSDPDSEHLARYLHGIETVSMGLQGDLPRCREVAAELRRLVER